MYTTSDGFIVEADEDGIGIIPAPPSPQEPATLSYYNLDSAISSMSSSLPSRDSVSAAIALVRAKQIAKNAIQRAEEQILKPRSSSSDHTTASQASDSSSKGKATSINESTEGENTAPVSLRSGEKLGLSSNLQAPTTSSIVIESNHHNRSDALTAEAPSYHDGIPAVPSIPSNASTESGEFDETVDAKTIDDVNAFLNRLGVGALRSDSDDSDGSSIRKVDSIEKLRMGGSGSTDSNSYDTDDENQSLFVGQPKTLAEISAFIDTVTKVEEQRKQFYPKQAEPTLETLEEEEASMQSEEEAEPHACVDTETEVSHKSRTTSTHELLEYAQHACKDPPPTSGLEVPDHKADPPAPSPSHQTDASAQVHQNERVNPFLDLSYQEEETVERSDPSPTATSNDEEEERVDDASEEDGISDKPSNNQYVDKSFAPSVHKTLSTVEEVASVEAEDDESADNIESEKINDAELSVMEDEANAPENLMPQVASFEEQESVYGPDGRKEPKGIYEKAEVEVEKIPLADVGVEQNMNSDMSVMSADSQHVGIESQEEKKTVETSEICDATSSIRSQDSVPWALRDVASEETMRATGRRRPRFVVSGPRPSNKSRNVASLFDDTSIQASEAASELKTDASFGSENKDGESDEKSVDKSEERSVDKSEERSDDKSEEGEEIPSPDSTEGHGCLVDDILYSEYEPEDDYALLRGSSTGMFSNDENDKSKQTDAREADLTEPCDSKVADSEGEMIETENIEVVQGYGVCGEESMEGPNDSSKVEDVEVKSVGNDEKESDNFLSEGDDENIDSAGHISSQIREDKEQKLAKDPSGETDEDPPSGETDENQTLIQDPSGEMAGFEVLLDRLVISLRSDQVDQNELSHFVNLLLPLTNGHEPTFLETAQIRQSAQKANIPLNVVDEFLDKCSPSDLKASSSDDLALMSWGSPPDCKDEDDEDIEAFMSRVEERRRIAFRSAMSVVAAEVEATFKAEQEASNATEAIAAASNDTEEKEIEQNNSFLRQFEDLGFEEEVETDESVKEESTLSELQNMNVASNAMSANALRDYFSNIDNREFEGENEEKLVKDFKRLMMPIMDGKKPTIIEEAQVRQAALKVDVPLSCVDAFIEHIKDEKPQVAPQLSLEDETDFLAKGWEEIEDINEDAAIAAFLSAKFCLQVSSEGSESETSDDESQEYANEEKTKELMEQSSCDHNPEDDSVNSTIERDFTKSKTEEQTDCEFIECDTSNCDGTRDSIQGSDESDLVQEEHASDEFPQGVPNVVGTIKKEEIKVDSIDIDMLKACKRIKGFDEGIWQRRTAMATYGWEWKEATWLSQTRSPKASSKLAGVGTNGVFAGKDKSKFMFSKNSFPLTRKTCKLPYNHRVKQHSGYLDVDVYSLQECASYGQENMYKDETPWELRCVRQRFLHERSLTFSRNWFGDLVKTNGNDRIKAPVCKPKSMEMPMRNIPDPGDWTPEWFTSWGGQKFLLPRPSTEESDVETDTETICNSERGGQYGIDSLRSYSSGSSFSDDDEEDEWEDAPECGTLVNTKLKIGEHVSKVHPDYTSSLRKSRWRKKYFPIGTFPY